jgi:hypothetical protein
LKRYIVDDSKLLMYKYTNLDKAYSNSFYKGFISAQILLKSYYMNNYNGYSYNKNDFKRYSNLY